MYKICVNELLMLSGRLTVTSRLLVVKFWGSQSYMCRGLAPLMSALFRRQWYKAPQGP